MQKNKFEIIFENNNLFVGNKQSGVVVNRSKTSPGGTLQDLIEDKIEFDINEDSEFLDRSGIVHRLDKETSGAIIIAKNSNSFRILQSQFKERRVKKEYIALAHGKIIPVKGEIKVSVGRLPWNRKRYGVVSGGRDSLTNYKVEKYFSYEDEDLSLVRCYPKTGRTHQIRVHLKHIGNPIFSDELYGGRKTARNDRKLLGRLFLHAEKITFFDPETDKIISCKADLPIELSQLLEKLKESNNNI